jgi:hypothetical protein
MVARPHPARFRYGLNAEASRTPRGRVKAGVCDPDPEVAQFARRGTAVTDGGRRPLAYAPPASGSELAPSGALMGCREKRAPETKPSPLRQGAGSRRSRSVDLESRDVAGRPSKAQVGTGRRRSGPNARIVAEAQARCENAAGPKHSSEVAVDASERLSIARRSLVATEVGRAAKRA